MNKKFLILSAALGAALAGTTATQPTPEKPAEVTLKSGEFIKVFASKPAPAKPASQPVAPQKVVVRQASLASSGFTRFIEKPHLRKVKYGKRRWVMV
jgi:hypothetical protein